MLHRHGVNVGGETVIVVICHHHAGEKFIRLLMDQPFDAATIHGCVKFVSMSSARPTASENPGARPRGCYGRCWRKP